MISNLSRHPPALFAMTTVALLCAAAVPGFAMTQLTDTELIDYVLGKAVRLSGLPAFPREQMPPIYIMPQAEINGIVCAQDPQNCRQLAAVFDDIGYRILVQDDMPLDSAFGWSFLIHETTHVLQYRLRGPEIFRDCEAVFMTEKEAYSVQDRYNKEEGQFLQASIVLRFFHCDEDQARKDYAESKIAWDKRTASGAWSVPAKGPSQ